MKRGARWVALAVASAGLGGCGGRPAPADLILTNARVYTLRWSELDAEGRPAPDAPHDAAGWRPDAEAVAIRGGRIVFVGTAAEVAGYQGDSTQVRDLAGATVLPGLIDSHTHVVELGGNLDRIDLTGVATEAEAVERVAARAASVPAGEWILGYGWDEGAWAGRYPTMRLLTERVPNHPVYLRSLHGFAGWGNRLAFERAGISAATAQSEGGTILKDAAGQPTGVVLNRAIEILDRAVPAPTGDRLERRIVQALDTMAAHGYVGVHEAGADGPAIAALLSLDRQGRLPVRVYPMLSVRDTALARAWTARGPLRDSTRMVQVRSVKAYYDGALGSRGARLLADYADSSGHRGVSGSEYGFDRQAVAGLMRAGFQVGVHAIGDAGNREVIAFFDSVGRVAPNTRPLRHRIEHAQVVHPDDFASIAAAGLIVSMEPPHAVEDKTWAEARLGPERTTGAYAWRTMRRNRIPLTLNSDLPGSDFDFFYGFHAAVRRQDKAGEPSAGWYPEQRLSPEEALRGYTSWSAYAGFSEGVTGILEAGRWADLTVVDIDPLRVAESEPARLLSGRVLLTIVNGRVAYQR